MSRGRFLSFSPFDLPLEKLSRAENRASRKACQQRQQRQRSVMSQATLGCPHQLYSKAGGRPAPRIRATLGLTASDDYYIAANVLVDERRDFGGFLRMWRARHNLTLRGLAEASKVPFPNISAIECGRLGAGRIVAQKLAQGLGLRGEQKKQFLDYAVFTNSRDRLSKEHLAYPAVLANLLPRMLRERGVKPQEIVETLWENPELIENPQSSVRETMGQPWLKGELAKYLKQEHAKATIVVVFLKDGRQIALRCEARVF
jgi:transcriptional regulator with XRE-family HTH domain